ncbi:hypothetical protein F183_A55040 (plasmid) [Bryobacterales bacterium F-183]|nr:hypothetical protein F183_A55040 [Bryobacterales bacterium F-183]
MTFSDHYKHWIGAFLWFAVGIFYWQTSRPGHDWGGDFSVYLWQADNFAEGRPYTQSSFVATARSERNHPGIYPPATSLFMSPVAKTLGWDYQGWKRWLAFPLWLSLPVWFAIGRHMGLPFWPAVLATLLFATSTIGFWIRDNVGSDTLFQLVSGVALLVILEGYKRGWDVRQPVGFGVSIALLLLLCYATRAAGLALVLAFFAGELAQHRRIRRVAVAAGVAFAIAIVVYNRWIFSANSQYGSQFEFLPMAYVANFLYYVRSHASIWQGSPAIPRYLLSLGGLLLALWVLWKRSVLQRPGVVELYVVISYAMVTVYSTTQNSRYLFGIYPLLVFLITFGLIDLAVHWKALRWLPAASATLAFLTLGLAWRTVDLTPLSAGVHQQAFTDVCQFLRNSPVSTLLSWNPRLFALYTQRPSVLYAKPGELDKQLASLPGKVAVVFYEHEMDREELGPYLQSHESEWDKTFDNGQFRVYLRKKEERPRL